MGINSSWDNDEKTIILMEFEGQWTWTDVQNVGTRHNQMIDEVTHPVDFIVDFSKSQHVPPGFLQHTRRVLSGAHPRSRAVILVGMNPLMRAGFDMMFRTYSLLLRSRMFKMAKSVDEARQLLSKLYGPAP